MKKKNLRIVCISDTHGKHNEFSKVFDLPNIKGDILIHTGDVDICYESFGKFFLNLPHQYKIIVPGNHDYIEEIYKYHNPSKNVYVLCNSTVKIEGITFFGHPWTVCEDSAKYFKSLPEIPKCDVVLTHVPPLHIFDLAWHPSNKRSYEKCDFCNKTHKRFWHWGSKELRKEIERVKPKYSIFGHVHDDPGVKKIGDTTYINATSYCVNFQKPIVFEYIHKEEEEEEELEEEEKENSYFPLKCLDRFLGIDGKTTENCEFGWRITEDGFLQNDRNKTFLTMIKNSRNEYVVFTTEKKDKNLSSWKMSPENGTLRCNVTGKCLDLDAYDSSRVIGWSVTGGKNQKWSFLC